MNKQGSFLGGWKSKLYPSEIWETPIQVLAHHPNLACYVNKHRMLDFWSNRRYTVVDHETHFGLYPGLGRINITHDMGSQLTHLPLDKMTAIWQTMLSSAFWWRKVLHYFYHILLKFHRQILRRNQTQNVSFTKINLKNSYANGRPFCPDLNMLKRPQMKKRRQYVVKYSTLHWKIYFTSTQL